jgi:hypothetical protein
VQAERRLSTGRAYYLQLLPAYGAAPRGAFRAEAAQTTAERLGCGLFRREARRQRWNATTCIAELARGENALKESAPPARDGLLDSVEIDDIDAMK